MNAKNDKADWFAFYTRSRAEKQISIRLLDRDFNVFLPLVTRIKQWSDRKKKVKEPLIRSYIFVCLPVNDITEVLKVPGIVNVVRYLGKPAVIRDNEIHNLRILVMGEAEKIDVKNSISIVKGEKVEVLQGPFKGLTGIYDRSKGKYRVIVKIETLGNRIEVDIPHNNLRIIK